MITKTTPKVMNLKRIIYLILIFGGFAIMHNFVPSGLDQASWDGFLVLFVAVFLWLTEAVPMAVTSVFVLFFAAWMGVESQEKILSGFSGTGVFFLLAAMIIGQIFTKAGLGKRISLYILPLLGNKANMVLLSVMLGTCIVSMFLADIPTALIFFGICAPLLEQNGCVPGQSKYGRALMLGIPIASALGGIGTPAGSGMNAITMSLLKSICGVEITFTQWSVVGVPVAIVSTVLAWLFLTAFYKSEIDVVKGLDALKEDRKSIGPMRGRELKFTIVFIVMVILWFIPKYTGINMYMTAWAGIFVMSMPGMDMVDWKEINGNIDWSTVLICGAATALAAVVSNLGSGEWLSGILANLFLSEVAGMGLMVLLLVINIMMAVGHYPMPQGVSLVGLCLPVVGALAIELGLNPIVVAMPVCMSTSMLMLIPIDPTCYTTYSGGYWRIKDMMGSGVIITVGYIVVSTLWITMVAGMGLLG
ncbi:DASS family sodium-coupled anion symporter [Hydrogenoanaerobacterium sp.]|uniref:SLC13 family permease n=1 Tax=Hydrogenoanaerobacterium sp. TaxID=2953763 RepID=UPI0028A1ED36|nr:DASS family sodium-coupled anion symporter [Hydrogenoanaerobacterium sp.]